MTPAEFSVTIIGHNLHEIAHFYQKWFDMELTLELDWFVSLRRPDAPWEVCAWKSGHETIPDGLTGTPNGIALAFVVDDAAGLFSNMMAADSALRSELKDEPWGQRHFYVADPAGTVIDVVQFTEPDPDWIAAQSPA